jgi:hypothetical protein
MCTSSTKQYMHSVRDLATCTVVGYCRTSNHGYILFENMKSDVNFALFGFKIVQNGAKRSFSSEFKLLHSFQWMQGATITLLPHRLDSVHLIRQKCCSLCTIRC